MKPGLIGGGEKVPVEILGGTCGKLEITVVTYPNGKVTSFYQEHGQVFVAVSGDFRRNQWHVMIDTICMLRALAAIAE